MIISIALQRREIMRLLITFLLTLLITACGSETKESSKTAVKSPFEPQLKALQKAKDMEKKISQAAEKQRKILDSITNDGVKTEKKDDEQ